MSVGLFVLAAGCKKGEAGAGDGGAPSSSGSAAASASSTRPPPRANGTAEVHDFKVFPSGPVAVHYFVGEIVVTSPGPVYDPSFKIVLKDADGTAIDSGQCFYQGTLQPGEKAPCYGEFFKAAKWATNTITQVVTSAPAKPPSATLTVSDTKLVAGVSHEVDGKVTNSGSAVAKGVMAYVSLYGADGTIVGAGNAFIPGNDLEPGASAKFEVKVYHVDGNPKTFAVKMAP